MKIELHPHARDRLIERGATKAEVVYTVQHGQRSAAKFGRTRFVHVFAYNKRWLGKRYARKQIEAFAAPMTPDGWLVVTIIVKFF